MVQDRNEVFGLGCASWLSVRDLILYVIDAYRDVFHVWFSFLRYSSDLHFTHSFVA